MWIVIRYNAKMIIWINKCLQSIYRGDAYNLTPALTWMDASTNYMTEVFRKLVFSTYCWARSSLLEPKNRMKKTIVQKICSLMPTENVLNHSKNYILPQHIAPFDPPNPKSMLKATYLGHSDALTSQRSRKAWSKASPIWLLVYLSLNWTEQL